MRNTRRPGRKPLFFAEVGLAGGAAIHLAAWTAGPSWVEALGAPSSIVASTAARSPATAIGTSVIVAILVGLALCCRSVSVVDRGAGRRRHILGVAAALFVARGLLVIPYWLSGTREWRTPIGHFAVTGRWFAEGSIVVLAIGVLIGIGLIRSGRAEGSQVLADPRSSR